MRARRQLWLLAVLQVAVALVLLAVAWRTLPDLFARLQVWLESFGDVVYDHEEIQQRVDLCHTLSWVAVGFHVGFQSLGALWLPWRRQWARRITLFFLVANLIFFPLGTGVGVYGLWLLMRRETRQAFARQGTLREAPPVDPPAPGDDVIRTTS